MNKLNSIYATDLPNDDSHSQSQLRHSISSFRHKLNATITETIASKRHLITKGTSQCLEQLQKIREQAGKYRKQQQRQQKEFQEKVERHIQGDIEKWNDYQLYFKAGFEQLEESLQAHQAKNRQYLRKIEIKKVQLKALLQEQRQSHIRISSLVKRAQQRKSNPTTKESTILAESMGRKTAFAVDAESSIKRIKTDQSLPLLKPVHRYDRIKTIQSDYQQDEPKRVKSYMEPIGTLRKKESSALGMLLELLSWYRQKEENNIGDNWFLKVLFNERHFNKLTYFLQANSTVRKVQRKL